MRRDGIGFIAPIYFRLAIVSDPSVEIRDWTEAEPDNNFNDQSTVSN